MKHAMPDGFTLIELLVVIAIVSVLMAFLLPALQRARAAAQVTYCAGTERQIGACVYAFADDFDGYLPCGGFARKKAGYKESLFPPTEGIEPGSGGNGINESWDERVLPDNLWWPYWSGLQKAMCPSHPSRTAWLQKIADGLDSWQHTTTYLLASKHFSRWHLTSRAKQRLADRPHPEKLFMFLEREDYPHQDSNGYTHGGHYDDSSFQHNWTAYCVETLGYHHNDYNGFNALFFDGHIRFYRVSRQPATRAEEPFEVSNWE